jgi:glutamate dehydrogenase (NAD(P)+)
VTGKPVGIGGIRGRVEATGRGVQYALREFFRHPDDMKRIGMTGTLAGKTMIFQGLGNVGYHAAKFFQEEDDAVIIAIIEHDGAIINPKGLNVEAVRQHINETGGVKGFAGATEFIEDGKQVLEMECDILVPSALESQITVDNADRIKAKMVVEAANGPVTFAADEILRQRGILILPDFYVNAGGVTVSYFEWIKNLQHIRFGRMERRLEEYRSTAMLQALEELTGKQVPDTLRRDILIGADELSMVRSGLDDTMRGAYQEISEAFHQNPDIEDYRTAAFVVSISKIAQTMKRMGV